MSHFVTLDDKQYNILQPGSCQFAYNIYIYIYVDPFVSGPRVKHHAKPKDSATYHRNGRDQEDSDEIQ